MLITILYHIGFAMADNRVQVCHYPPGNTENWRIITISVNALAKHLAHGDKIPMTFYEDFDEDGYGNPDVSIENCEISYGFVEDDTDCDDIDPEINPGMDEITNDGVDNDCDPATSDEVFTFTGVLTDVPKPDMVGWNVCYQDTYDYHLTAADIQSSCTKANIMLACGQVGSTTYKVVAHAPREDVFFDTGLWDTYTTNVANGVGWYFATDYSMGFAPEGEQILKYGCDGGYTLAEKRLCWHTLGYAGGWSCGAERGLNSNSSWERFVLEAD
jgi:hypothetical protein